jgi:hypothetical protein
MQERLEQNFRGIPRCRDHDHAATICEPRIHKQGKSFEVRKLYASSAELVRERYAVQAIPTVETKGCKNCQ